MFIEELMLQDDVDFMLTLLPDRERFVIIHYYGLLGNSAKTYKEISLLLSLCRVRCSQILCKALRRCRKFFIEHPQCEHDFMAC
jgi:RNA polymerase primary sigma factor